MKRAHIWCVESRSRFPGSGRKSPWLPVAARSYYTRRQAEIGMRVETTGPWTYRVAKYARVTP